MKTLVACEFPESALSELRSLGMDVHYEPTLQSDVLPARLKHVAVLIVSGLRVSPDAIAAGNSLQLIVVCEGDVSNIAVDQASAEGIFVANCRDTDAVAIAESIFAYLLALDRGLAPCDQSAVRPAPLRRPALGLAGRSFGLLGFGPVGEALAKRARAFDMHVRGWSGSLTPELAEKHRVKTCAWPREIAERCDLIAAYAPAGTYDEALFDEEFFEHVRRGASLVFVGHPSALHAEALSRATSDRGLRVAIDVLPCGPGSESFRLRSNLPDMPGVIVTPCLANRTAQARDATAVEVVRILRNFLVGGELLNCVNLLERSPATWLLVLRLRDAVGVMAEVMQAVRADGINAEEITSRVFKGARAAWCTVALDERPSTEALDAIGAIDGVLHCELRAMV